MKALLLAAAAGVVAGLLAAPAHADDDDTRAAVCTGFNLGLTPEQIAEGLERGDPRLNYWAAWRASALPILEGDCNN